MHAKILKTCIVWLGVLAELILVAGLVCAIWLTFSAQGSKHPFRLKPRQPSTVPTQPSLGTTTVSFNYDLTNDTYPANGFILGACEINPGDQYCVETETFLPLSALSHSDATWFLTLWVSNHTDSRWSIWTVNEFARSINGAHWALDSVGNDEVFNSL